MPYESVYHEREVYLEYKGVTVYHDYDDGDFDDRLIYHFSLSEEEDGPGFDARLLFDVRDLPTWPCDAGMDEAGRIEWAIRSAIDQGIIKQDGVTEDEEGY